MHCAYSAKRKGHQSSALQQQNCCASFHCAPHPKTTWHLVPEWTSASEDNLPFTVCKEGHRIQRAAYCFYSRTREVTKKQPLRLLFLKVINSRAEVSGFRVCTIEMMVTQSEGS